MRHPEVTRYARYRAAIEVAGMDRSRWPEAWRRGTIEDGEVPRMAVLRHTYAQFATDTQLGEVAAALHDSGSGLLLDLPLGCARDAFDPWAYRHAFSHGASIGAPPDDFFASGQDWGFAPPHPEGDRALGYPLFRASLATSLRHAGALRIDHVLGFSRLWWIPDGHGADDGAYVSYHRDELLAVACLEAARAQAHLVGEDLGTVQLELRRALGRHRVSSMRVALFELEATGAHPPTTASNHDPAGTSIFGPPRLHARSRSATSAPAPAFAFVDTHDTATFAGWLEGADLDLRRSLGDIDPATIAASKKRRDRVRRMLAERFERSGATDATSILAGVLEELGASDSAFVVVALEDLWAEREPQNVPGTGQERANFARMLMHPLEEAFADPAVVSILERLDGARRHGIRYPSAPRAPGAGGSGPQDGRPRANARRATDAPESGRDDRPAPETTRRHHR